MANHDVPIPIPVPNFDNEGFWAACTRHELCLQRCTQCHAYRHHPRPMCPQCNSLDYTWSRVSGNGVVYSFTIAHGPTLPAFQPRVPYNVAVIQLEEGPYMVSNVVDCANDELHIGMPVRVAFEDISDGMSLPKFRPR